MESVTRTCSRENLRKFFKAIPQNGRTWGKSSLLLPGVENISIYSLLCIKESYIKKVKRKKFLGKHLEIKLDQKISNFLKCQDKMNFFWNFRRTPAVLEIHFAIKRFIKLISLVYIFHKRNHNKKYSINTDVQCTH